MHLFAFSPGCWVFFRIMISELNLGHPSSIVKRWEHASCVPCVFLSCASSEDAGNEDTFPWIPTQIQEKRREEIARFWLYIHETLREGFNKSPSSPPLRIDFFVEASLNSFECYIWSITHVSNWKSWFEEFS